LITQVKPWVSLKNRSLLAYLCMYLGRYISGEKSPIPLTAESRQRVIFSIGPAPEPLELKSSGSGHRNLRSRTSVLAQVLQTFWAKNLVTSLLISTLDNVIYYIGTFLQGSKKPLFTTQNRVEIS
jgi:hypothetical protein